MKKLLLTAAMAAIVAGASAENKAYFFKDRSGEFEQMGQVYGISPNGEYAVIYDEEMEESFLWRRSDPENLEFINQVINDVVQATQIYSVTDDGTIIGSYRMKGSLQWKPFIKEQGGEILDLPLPEWALNMNFAIAASDNMKVNGGQLGGHCEPEGSNGGWGQNRPCMWVKGSDGEYTVVAPSYEELTLPEHDGTTVTGMFSDGTYEGSYLFGICGCGAGSHIPFLYNQEELTLWNKIDHALVPFYYKGQVLSYFRYETIDGKRDLYFSDSDEISAGLRSCDAWGNIYGSRAEVYDVQGTDPDDDETFGKAKHRNYNGYYNVYTKQWTESVDAPTFSAGLNGEILFTGNNTVLTGGLNGTAETTAEYAGVNYGGRQVMGVERTSRDGNTLGICYLDTDGAGVQHLYAGVIALDKGLVGVDSVTADPESEQVVITYGGTIEVIGAQEVAVYDMNGANVANGNACNVGSGVYVVVADGVSHKVFVK